MEQKGQILNTSLLNPSVQNKMQQPGEVCKNLGWRGLNVLQEPPQQSG